MKTIIWIFYLIGVLLIGTWIHEYIHYLQCGGEFIAGLGYIRDEYIHGGITFCTRPGANEVVPYIVESVFECSMVLVKIIYDRRLYGSK